MNDCKVTAVADVIEFFDHQLLRPGEAPEVPLDLHFDGKAVESFVVPAPGKVPERYCDGDYVVVRPLPYEAEGETPEQALDGVKSQLRGDAARVLLAAASRNPPVADPAGYFGGSVRTVEVEGRTVAAPERNNPALLLVREGPTACSDASDPKAACVVFASVGVAVLNASRVRFVGPAGEGSP